MKAVVINEHGDINKLNYVTDFPEPKPRPGEAIVRIEAAGVNRIDQVVRNGYPGIGVSMPHIPGADIIGTVAEIGREVAQADIGDRVAVYPIITCGQCLLCKEGKPNLCLNWKYIGLHVPGGYAEYVSVPADNLVRLPDNISSERAAVTPVSGLTAWHGLKTVGKLKAGQTFFIWGGSGALGTIAIQLAKHIGAEVIATGNSDKKLEMMKNLGADYVFNRLTDDIPAEVKKIAPFGVDLILDYVGPKTFGISFDMLKRGGTMLLCGIITGRETEFSIHMTYLRHLSVKGLYLGTKDEMKEIIGLIAEGKINPHMGRILDLNEAAEAHRMMEENSSIGKIILKP